MLDTPNENISALSRLPLLESLAIGNTHSVGRQLRDIANTPGGHGGGRGAWPALTHLTVDFGRGDGALSNTHLVPLAVALPTLTRLTLHNITCSGAGFGSLKLFADFRALTQLDFERVTDVGAPSPDFTPDLSELGAVRSLQTLTLAGFNLRESDTTRLAGLAQLLRLGVNHCGLTDDTLRPLQRSEAKLVALSLAGNPLLTDKIEPVISRFSATLARLDLRCTGVPRSCALLASLAKQRVELLHSFTPKTS